MSPADCYAFERGTLRLAARVRFGAPIEQGAVRARAPGRARGAPRPARPERAVLRRSHGDADARSARRDRAGRGAGGALWLVARRLHGGDVGSDAAGAHAGADPARAGLWSRTALARAHAGEGACAVALARSP